MAALKAATWPRDEPMGERLLTIDPETEGIADARIGDLPALLAPGDLLVVNDAATLPASLATRDGEELRLLARLGDDTRWRALLLGAGDWRLPTEERTRTRRRRPGEVIALCSELSARVEQIDAEEPRLIEIQFDRSGAELWSALYRLGKPVQYAYLRGPLALWHVQNRYASQPWAVELASAGRPLTFGLLRALKQRGVELASVTHAAGLSSTGSPALDRRLPFREHYAIPEDTVRAVLATRAAGGRIVAVGTTVVRALESAALDAAGGLRAGEADANLRIGPGFLPRLVDGLLSGMHDRGTSHFALLEAFAPRALLDRAMEHAEACGYLQHEFGDSCLILPSR